MPHHRNAGVDAPADAQPAPSAGPRNTPPDRRAINVPSIAGALAAEGATVTLESLPAGPPPGIGYAPAGPALVAGDVRRVVFWLALPVLGEQLMNAFVSWNDAYLAGHINVASTASIGVASYTSWLITMLFGLVGTGATAIVARSVGGRNMEEARTATNQSLVLALGMGLIATLIVPGAAPYLSRWLGASEETLDTTVRFLTIDSRAYVIEALTFIGAACLRGAGDTRTPMLMLVVVNIVNAAMSWFFAFHVKLAWPILAALGCGGIGMGLGCDGIAWGTFTARMVGGVIILAVLFRGRAGLVIHSQRLRPDFTMIMRVLRIGVPAALDGALIWTGQMCFLWIIGRTGGGSASDTILAAHFVGIRIESLSYMPAMAWATAAATLVGQNLGAGRPDRSRRCANEAVIQAACVLTTMGVLYFVFAAPFYHFLTKDEAVVAMGVPALRGLGIVQPALAVLIIYIYSLRGAGDTLFPALITVIGMAVVRIPLAWLGGVVLGGGLVGAWMGMYGDLLVRSILMSARFRSGRWAKVRV